MNETTREQHLDARPAEKRSGETAGPVPLSPTLARLIEEVRNEKPDQLHAYNRMHNRHNRSR